jgi:hypothetical protein
VKLDGRANFIFSFCNGLASGDAAWKVWNIGREIAACVFNDNCVFHSLPQLPACLFINAIQCSWRQIITKFAWNSNASVEKGAQPLFLVDIRIWQSVELWALRFLPPLFTQPRKK